MKNVSLSQFGAEMQASTTGKLNTIRNRPSLSWIVFVCTYCTSLWMGMATPRHLVLNLEWKIWEKPPLLSLEWSLLSRCVSVKNAMSVCSFDEWENTLLCITGWLSPLVFQFVNLVAIFWYLRRPDGSLPRKQPDHKTFLQVTDLCLYIVQLKSIMKNIKIENTKTQNQTHHSQNPVAAQLKVISYFTSVCCWCNGASRLCAGGWRRPVGEESWQYLGSGRSDSFWEWRRLWTGQHPIRLRPSIPVRVLDWEPDHHQPARLRLLCSRSALSSSAAVRLTAPLLTLCPLTGGFVRDV